MLVQHHPSRAHLLPELLARLAPLPAAVVTDPDADNPVPGSCRTYRACLERFPDDAAHALILQDDSVPWRGLPAALPGIIQAAPGEDPLIALWLGGGGPRAQAMGDALERGDAFLRLPGLFTPVVATVWSRSRREAILAEAPLTSEEHAGDQDVIDRWRRGRVPVVATVPSLVDHPCVVPSIRHPTKRADAARTTAVYIGD